MQRKNAELNVLHMCLSYLNSIDIFRQPDKILERMLQILTGSRAVHRYVLGYWLKHLLCCLQEAFDQQLQSHVTLRVRLAALGWLLKAELPSNLSSQPIVMDAALEESLRSWKLDPVALKVIQTMLAAQNVHAQRSREVERAEGKMILGLLSLAYTDKSVPQIFGRPKLQKTALT